MPTRHDMLFVTIGTLVLIGFALGTAWLDSRVNGTDRCQGVKAHETR